MDPHLLDAGSDPTYHFDADPDPDFYLMRIRMLNRILVLFDADADPEPTFHFDADHAFLSGSGFDPSGN